MQSEQRCVDVLLERKSSLHGLERRAPLVLLRSLDVLEDDTASTLVLVLHELFGVLALFVRLLLEELVEAREGHVVALVVERHRLVHVGRVQLEVDLLVYACLAFGMKVLSYQRHFPFFLLLVITLALYISKSIIITRL